MLVSAAAWMVAYNTAVAANPVSAQPDAKGHRAGELEIKPVKHDFGRVAQYSHSSPLTVTATNTSKSASIVFSYVEYHAGGFTIPRDGCSLMTLMPGQSCEVEIEFSPYQTGPVKQKRALIFNDSAENSPQHIELEGFGIQPSPTPSATPTITPTPPPGATPTVTPTPALPTPTITPTPKPAFSGHVFGGANPVADANVAVWQPGTTGFGTGAFEFPGTASTTANDGSFYSGIFACASPTQIYVTAQGGDAGGGANSSLMMMAAVGACDTIGFGANSYVVNEVTTAGSVNALAQFLSTSTPGMVGAPASDAAALADAFATLATLVDPMSGTARSGAAQETLNSIANALAACSQTGGASSPACTELFDCALPGAVFSAGACSGGTGSVTDTLSAALSIALNPTTVSIDGVFDVSTKAAVYSPALTTAPPDWSLP